MKKSIKIVLFVLVAILALLGYFFYKFYVNFPEEARFENLNQQYASLVIDLDKAIAKTNSADTLANELENIKYPAETLAVSLRGKSKKKRTGSSKSKVRKWNKQILIFDRINKGGANGARSSSHAMIQGGGYGTRNGQHFWILHHKLGKYGFDVIEILFVRERPNEQ